MILRLTTLLFLLATGVSAQTITSIIPGSHFPATGSYQNIAGIQGGINQYSTNYTMFCNVKISIPGTTNVAYGDGFHDDTAALNFAVQNCPGNEFVYMPGGQYLISAPISRNGLNNWDGVQHPYGIIIRGDGPANTIILNNGAGSAITLAWGSGFGMWGQFTNNLIGSTNLGLFSGSGYPVAGQWFMVARSNSVVAANVYTPPAGDANPFYYTYEFSDAQMVKAETVNGKAYTTWPALNEGYSTNDYFWGCWSPPVHCGIENLCVVQLRENGVPNIGIYGGGECWIRNVESRQARGQHIFLSYCGGCEVRECFVHEPFPNKDGADGGGSSDYGIDLANYSSSCLVEDNIALHCRHSFIMEQGCGQDNVIAYNYSKDNINESLFETDYQMDTDYHGGEPRYNLWEGNVLPIIRADAVEGATKYDIYFRNLVTRDGLPSVNVALFAMDVQRGNYYDYFLGNVYGICVASPSYQLYRIGSWQDTQLYPGTANAYDPMVVTNDVWLGNYDFSTGLVDKSTDGVINWQKSIAASLPPSLCYAGKPAWYPNNLNWPPFGFDVAGITNLIPAQVRALAIPGFNTPISDGYVLTATNTSGGAVTAVGNGSYYNTSWVAIAAVTKVGYTFAGWSGYPVANSNSPVTYLVMPAANIAVTANFIAGTNYVATVVNGNGSGLYVAGAAVSINAGVSAGQQFAYWNVSLANIMANTNSAATTFTMPAGNVTVTAVFGAISRPLTPPSNLQVQ